MSFQTHMNIDPPQAWPGDFASANPRYTTIGGEGACRAGAALTAATFGWLQSDGVTVLNSGTTTPDGFIRRGGQGNIPNYLGNSSMSIPKGFMVTVFPSGDFWVKSAGAATRGASVYCDATGAIADSAATGAIKTNFIYATAATAAGEMVVITAKPGV